MDLPTALAAVNQRRETPFTLGWVTAAHTSTIVVHFADGSTATIPKLRSYETVNINDVVIVLRHNGAMFALGAVNDAPVPPPEPDEGDEPPPEPPTVTRTFRPESTGTWLTGSGWLGTSDLYQGINEAATGTQGHNLGAAYYGQAPSGYEVAATTAGTLRIRRNGAGDPLAALRPTLTLLAGDTRPSVPPVARRELTGPGLRPGQDAVVDLPTSWTDDLMSGAAGGIGIAAPNQASSPYLGLSGRSTWAASMELTITYQRATT